MSKITLESVDANVSEVKGIATDTRNELRRLNGTVDKHGERITRIESDMMTKDDCADVQEANRGAWRQYLLAVATGATLYFLFQVVPKIVPGGGG